jgi:hypothetical protein
MATELKDVAERIKALMRDSKKWPRMKKRFYTDYKEDHLRPCVVVLVDSGVIGRTGVRFEREDITVKVNFEEKAPKRTKTKPLYQDVEILRALLHTQSRLGNLADCHRGVVTGYRQMFGAGLGYLIDIMEVTVEVWLDKTY